MIIPYIGPYLLKQAKEGDAGYDISSNESKTVWAGASAIFSTGLFMAIPRGFEGEMRSRSGLAFNHDIECSHGTIDSGYRGEIKIKLYNFGKQKFVVHAGDRIAQLVISPVAQPEFVQVDSLDDTERGGGGFGHTGI